MYATHTTIMAYLAIKSMLDPLYLSADALCTTNEDCSSVIDEIVAVKQQFPSTLFARYTLDRYERMHSAGVAMRQAMTSVNSLVVIAAIKVA